MVGKKSSKNQPKERNAKTPKSITTNAILATLKEKKSTLEDEGGTEGERIYTHHKQIVLHLHTHFHFSCG